jgi:hypothetical protein
MKDRAWLHLPDAPGSQRNGLALWEWCFVIGAWHDVLL